jgi:hypothetical protein
MVIASHLCVTICDKCHVFNILIMLILSLCLLKTAMNAKKRVFHASFTSALDGSELQSYYELLVHQEHTDFCIYSIHIIYSRSSALKGKLSTCNIFEISLHRETDKMINT